MADPRAALDAAALRGTRGVDLTVWPPRYDPAYRPAPDAEHWLPEVECAPLRGDRMANGECRHRTGMHLWQDLVYTEVCDPETHRAVPFGDEGTPVYTHLERTSQPMIRLVSGDRARWTGEPCPCGRTYPRLPAGIYGRFDDMLVVRGENVYPSAIEDALRAIPGFGGEFRVIVSRREAMDELLVRAEYGPDHGAPASQAALRDRMRERLRARLGVHPVVELVAPGTLPRSEFKARRVVDDRDLYRQGIESER
jgi:phenylacetate-CoA ligase